MGGCKPGARQELRPWPAPVRTSPSLPFVYGCISLWILLSVSMVLLNKHLLSYTAFRFPVTLAFWHMAVATCLSWAAVHICGMPNAAAENTSLAFQLHMLGVGALFAVVLCLGNAAFMHLSVPSIQMLKAGTPASIFVMGLAMGTERYSHKYAANILVICAGVALASWGDYNFSAAGFFLQVSSILVDALRCILLQKLLQAHDVGLNPITTLYHVAPGAMIALSVPMMFVEGEHIQALAHNLLESLPLVVASGFLAFALNLVIFAIIGATSALTCSLTGVLKEWITIFVSMRMYSINISAMQWAGYTIALSGLVCYQYNKVVKAATAVVEAPSPKAGSDSDKAVEQHNPSKV